MNDGIRKETPVEAARGPFPWQRGWSIFKAIWPQLIYISVAAIAIPQYLVYWITAQRAAHAVQDWSTNPPLGFFNLLQKVETFSLFSVSLIIAAGILAFWGYLSWVTAAFHHIDGQKVETLPVFKKSLRNLPRSLLTFFMFFLVLVLFGFLTAAGIGFGIISQLILITLCVMASAAPVLLVMDSAGSGRILSASLRMEYTRGSGMSRWSAYFVLLTYEMLLLGSLSLVQAGVDALNHLDMKMSLPRAIWFVSNQNFPFGVVPMLTEALAISLSALLFSLFAIMTTSFVADLRRIGQIRSKIEIKV